MTTLTGRLWIGMTLTATLLLGIGCSSEDGDTDTVATVTGTSSSQNFLFSLDIGSDTELSDPTPDGNEGADPGDLYETAGASFTVSGGADGIVDDETSFGGDLPPNPPDSTPPTSGVPVGGGCLPPGPPACYGDYLDIDGYDVVNVNFSDLGMRPNQPLDSPLLEADFPDEYKYCIEYPVFLAVSFDDDGPRGWATEESRRVPVETPSPTGRTHGSSEVRDEMIAVTLYLSPTGGAAGVDKRVGIAAEKDVHIDLAPNPDDDETVDDDVDALDIIRTDEPCDITAYSVDHEARGSLKPGTIYISDGTGIVFAIRGSVHLGISQQADIDAFEFAWLDDSTGAKALAVVFSVDDDDVRTPTLDESGGLDPGALYASFMDGSSFELAHISALGNYNFYAIDYVTEELVEINPRTGAGVSLGTIPGGNYQGMATNSHDVIFTMSDGDNLFEIDLSGPSVLGSSSPRPKGAGGHRAMAFGAENVLYVILSASSTAKVDRLFTVDATGAYTAVGSSGGATGQTDIQGLAANERGELYALSNAGDLFTVSTTTAVATFIGGPAEPSDDSQALEFDDFGRLFRVRRSLWEVNPETGGATLIGDTGFDDLRGLAIVGGTGDDIDAITISVSDLDDGL